MPATGYGIGASTAGALGISRGTVSREAPDRASRAAGDRSSRSCDLILTES